MKKLFFCGFLLVSINLYSQSINYKEPELIEVSLFQNKLDFFTVDILLKNIKTGDSFYINDAFYGSIYDVKISNEDLDEDHLSEFIIIGPSGGNQVTTIGYIVDLKKGIKPICKFESCDGNTNFFFLNSLLLTGNSGSGYIAKQFKYCLKYKNGKLYFDNKSKNIEFYGFVKLIIENYKNYLIINMDNFYQGRMTDFEAEEYENTLQAMIIQSLIADEDTDMIGLINYYYKASDRIEIIKSILESYIHVKAKTDYNYFE